MKNQIFHKRGLAYFWVFNDKCDLDELQPQLDAFARAGDVSALCLHPRPGLLLPYGGRDWFDFIKEICRRIADAGLDIWLYDEDPFPSGAAGGRVFLENPEFCARHVEKFTFDPSAMDDELFAFPPGELLWCGAVNEQTGETIDYTDRVGMVRRQWSVWETWDSRFFYPDTPLYRFPRADTSKNEFALKVPPLRDGMKLMAFVARTIAYDWISWENLPDSLNPRATQRFLELTHEKYREAVGDMFGKEITAIFTDEPKYFSKHPWTPGMAGDFQQTYGYDVRQRLFHLFSESMSDEACITRLHWREYCGRRFEKAWLEPVSRWCREHKLKLVGHVSPEDDPVQQSECISNLFPLFKHFDLAGIDLIIPAVGDRNHPIINVGCTSATSYAQQHHMPGVMSETGACSGLDYTAEEFGRLVKWQTVMGVTTPLVHCAFSSVRGPRAYDFPANYGPNNPNIWPGMPKVHRDLAELQSVMHDARQIAPVAILWPIRSFQMQNIDWLNDTTGMRRNLNETLAACLDRQVGVHILDEEVLWSCEIERSQLVKGLACYTHILIPSCTVLHATTVEKLKAVHQAGIQIICTGQTPERQQTDHSLAPLDLNWARQTDPSAASASLPQLLSIEGDATDIRCTAWEKEGVVRRLIINLRNEPYAAKFDANRMTLSPGEVYVLDHKVNGK